MLRLRYDGGRIVNPQYARNLHELSSSPSIISLLHISSSTLLNASPLTRGPFGFAFLGVGDIEARW
jgi:hypothetical protein